MAEIILITKEELKTLIYNSISDFFSQQKIKEENKEKYLSLAQAAEYLQLAKQTLYGFTSKRKIPFIKKGKKIYFQLTELNKWLESGKKKSRSEIEKELISGKK